MLIVLLKAHKIIATAYLLGAIVLAAAESTSNRTLIIIAILGNFTLLIVSLISAAVSYLNRKTVQQLPGAIQKLEISLDGRLKEMMETKQALAHQEGMAQERSEERTRVAEAAPSTVAAIAQAAAAAANSDPDKVSKMEIVSSDENPVTTKQAKPLSANNKNAK